MAFMERETSISTADIRGAGLSPGRDNGGLVTEAQELVKAANELRTRLVVINNALSGPQPKDRDDGAKSPAIPNQIPLMHSLAEAQSALAECHKLASFTYEILGI